MLYHPGAAISQCNHGGAGGRPSRCELRSSLRCKTAFALMQRSHA